MKRRTLKDLDAVMGTRRVAKAKAVARRKMEAMQAGVRPDRYRMKIVKRGDG